MMADKIVYLHAKLHLECLKNGVRCFSECERGNAGVKVSLSVLGRRYITGVRQLSLPLDINETFSLDRQFQDLRSLLDLWAVLDSEVVYVELLRDSPPNEHILATFESSAMQLLLPRKRQLSSGSCSSTAAVELLLDPTDSCPGSVRPSLHLSVDVFVHHPAKLAGCAPPIRKKHLLSASAAVPAASVGSKKETLAETLLRCRPPFAWRHVDSHLMTRTPGVDTLALSLSPSRSHSRSRAQVKPSARRGRHCHCACADREAQSSGTRPLDARSRSLASVSGRRRRRGHLAVGGRSVSASCAGGELSECSVHRAAAVRQKWSVHCEQHCSVCAAYQRRFCRPYQPHFPPRSSTSTLAGVSADCGHCCSACSSRVKLYPDRSSIFCH